MTARGVFCIMAMAFIFDFSSGFIVAGSWA
jgi:hypothetical protein